MIVLVSGLKWLMFYGYIYFTTPRRATNVHESSSDSVTVTVKEPEGEPVKVCIDRPDLANCDLIVRAQLCAKVTFYAEFCCKSCSEAGQL